MSRTPRVRTDVYREIFAASYGLLPHLCYFCGKWIFEWGRGKGEGTIHHLDGDDTNNDPANLVPAHSRCHLSHHANGRIMSIESSEKKRAANARRSPCPDCGVIYNPIWMTRHIRVGRCINPTPEQIAEGQRENTTNAEKMRQAWADGKFVNAGRYERSAEYRARVAAQMRERPVSEETRRRMSESQRASYAKGDRRRAPGRPTGVAEKLTPCPNCGREMRGTNLARHVTKCSTATG